MMAIQLYAVDGFKFPASAFASISVLRCLFAGVFPLFGPKLFEELGVDWGVGLLAFLTLGVGLPLVLIVCFPIILILSHLSSGDLPASSYIYMDLNSVGSVSSAWNVLKAIRRLD